MPRYTDMSRMVFERTLEIASETLPKRTLDAVRELLAREQIHNIEKLKDVVEGSGAEETKDAD